MAHARGGGGGGGRGGGGGGGGGSRGFRPRQRGRDRRESQLLLPDSAAAVIPQPCRRVAGGSGGLNQTRRVASAVITAAVVAARYGAPSPSTGEPRRPTEGLTVSATLQLLLARSGAERRTRLLIIYYYNICREPWDGNSCKQRCSTPASSAHDLAAPSMLVIVLCYTFTYVLWRISAIICTA
eukprot:COSAG01_NODE_24332_length_783_cov_0.701754_1_plen_183_part_00